MDLPLLVEYLGIGINATEIRTITPIGEDGIHVDFRHGGFVDIDRGCVQDLLALIESARRAAAPF